MEKDTPLVSEDTIPSSPAAAIFSDEAARPSTPPSSPPGFPWEQQHASTETQRPQPAQNNAFSLLGKRKALDSISENARLSKKLAPAQPAPKALSQMQISLGQTVQKRCKVCGMEYIPSAPEDRKLHDKYHRQNVEGYDVGKDFVRKTQPHAVFSSGRKDDAICLVNCYDTPSRKRRGQAVLGIVQRELGAVDIPQDELWVPPKSSEKYPDAKFHMYLYIRGTKCIGLLLAQQIKEAFRVIEPPSAYEGAGEYGSEQYATAAGKLKARQQALAEQLKRPLQLSRERYPARLGISRIWTSSTHRRGNIATALLQAALDHRRQSIARHGSAQTDVVKGRELEASQIGLELQSGKLASAVGGPHPRAGVAFSQPTDAGTRLARKWFGRDYGWAVYID